VACPFFMPTSRFDDGGWIHPSRLPLGGGWKGQCCAPGHEGAEPAAAELRELCNLGYSTNCSRIPKERACDAVRFSVSRDCASHLTICFVCEAAHLPVAHGTLDYDLALQAWISPHSDPRIQRMAVCYLESYLQRRTQPAQAGLSSTNS
jgi:hypothetical protein